MPNEQTSVPLYAASEILTAANMNISAGTGVPVFATTVTRDAAFGGAGEKVLAEGQLCYLSSTNVVQYYDGAAWATVGPSTAGGLTLVSATTIGTTVASVTVSGAFSATYDNYFINISGGIASGTVGLKMTLGATATGYYSGGLYNTFGSATTTATNQSNTAFWNIGAAVAATLSANINLTSPNLAKVTLFNTNFMAALTGGDFNIAGGFLNDTTAYTAFTITPTSGTLTGGTIRVYGYQNS